MPRQKRSRRGSARTSKKARSVAAEDIADGGLAAAVLCMSRYGHNWSNLLYDKEKEILTMGIEGMGIQVCRVKRSWMDTIVMLSRMGLSDKEIVLRFDPPEYTFCLRVAHVKKVSIIKAQGKILACVEYNDESNAIRSTDVFIGPHHVDDFAKKLREAGVRVLD